MKSPYQYVAISSFITERLCTLWYLLFVTRNKLAFSPSPCSICYGLLYSSSFWLLLQGRLPHTDNREYILAPHAEPRCAKVNQGGIQKTCRYGSSREQTCLCRCHWATEGPAVAGRAWCLDHTTERAPGTWPWPPNASLWLKGKMEPEFSNDCMKMGTSCCRKWPCKKREPLGLRGS